MNAAEEGPIRDIIEAIARGQNAPRYFMSGRITSGCRRLEVLLLGSTVLSPVLSPSERRGQEDGLSWGFGGDGYGLLFKRRSLADALATSGLVLAAAVAAGLLVVACVAALRCGRGGFVGAAVSARFPATSIQCFVFLSHGAAIACGLSASDGGATSAVSIAVLVVVPLAWAAAVGCCAPAAAVGGCTVAVASPSAVPRRANEYADDDPLTRGNAPESIAGGCFAGRALLCGAVRPSALSASLGPVLGDIGGCYPCVLAGGDGTSSGESSPVGGPGAALRSLQPAALPWALLVAAIVVKAVAACEHMPLVAAALVALYAAFVAAFRPFTGYSHNAFEALWSAVAAGLLLWLWLAWDGPADESGQWAAAAGWAHAFSPSEHAAVTCLGALLSCRYPFVLARALGVGVPRVVAIVDCRDAAQALCTLRSSAAADDEMVNSDVGKPSVPLPPHTNAATSAKVETNTKSHLNALAAQQSREKEDFLVKSEVLLVVADNSHLEADAVDPFVQSPANEFANKSPSASVSSSLTSTPRSSVVRLSSLPVRQQKGPDAAAVSFSNNASHASSPPSMSRGNSAADFDPELEYM